MKFGDFGVGREGSAAPPMVDRIHHRDYLKTEICQSLAPPQSFSRNDTLITRTFPFSGSCGSHARRMAEASLGSLFEKTSSMRKRSENELSRV